MLGLDYIEPSNARSTSVRPPGIHGNQAGLFAQVKRIVGDNVPICLHENGPIPDPATLGPKADWVWFITWHTRWLQGPQQNAPALLREYYQSARYVTKGELPAVRDASDGARQPEAR